MENVDMSGIPWQLVVGFGCNLLALLFWFVWPKSKADAYKRISWPGYVLHFFHPLAWELFGIAAFMQPANLGIAVILATLGAIAYMIFIAMLIKA